MAKTENESTVASTAEPATGRSASGGSKRAARPLMMIAAAGVCLLLAWLTDTLWSPFSPGVLRIIVGTSLLSACFAFAQLLLEMWRGLESLDGEERDAWAGRTLLALIALSIVTRFAGLDFELVDHYHNDEGVFFAEAKRINSGRMLPGQFNYPHLLFYLSAITLWLFEQFPDAIGALPRAIYGLESEFEVRHMLLRILSASFGALTTIPVFLAGRRVAGLGAGIAAGLLIVFSSVYNEVAHLVIADVPSGFFAALCLYFVARLLDGESYRDYLLAGAAAALAATSKYPAGVVAVAIVGIWIYWRARKRNFTLHLLASGIVSFGTFLAVMPALWLRLDDAFSGQGKDVAFGYRQYAQLGWAGVVKESNSAWYGNQILVSFGIGALVVGILGWFLLRARERWRLLGVAPYPLIYLALIISMNMVVKRNLQPVLPALALLLGVGISAWMIRAGRPALSAALLVLCTAAPAYRTAQWDVTRMRPGTAQLATEWIYENTPHGMGILREAYTPRLSKTRYATYNSRYAARIPIPRVVDGSLDYLLLAKNAFHRFEAAPERLTADHQIVLAERYKVLRGFDLVREFEPGPWRAGPHLFLYRIDPDPIEYRRKRRFEAVDAAYFSHPELRPEGDLEGPIPFQRKTQSVVFKDYFEPGSYKISYEGTEGPLPGYLYIVSRENHPVGEFEVHESLSFELPARGKYFFRVFLPGGSLTAVEIVPDHAAAPEPEVPTEP